MARSKRYNERVTATYRPKTERKIVNLTKDLSIFAIGIYSILTNAFSPEGSPQIITNYPAA
jgi:hypothetical protein